MTARDQFVQTLSGSSSSNGTVTVTLPNPSGVGNAIIAFAFDGSGGNVTSVADAQSAYFLGTQVGPNALNVTCRPAWLESVNATTHSVTMLGSALGGTSLHLAEIAGSGVGSILGTPITNGQTAPGAGADTLVSGNVTFADDATLVGFSVDTSVVDNAQCPTPGTTPNAFTSRDSGSNVEIGSWRLMTGKASSTAQATAGPVTAADVFITSLVVVKNVSVLPRPQVPQAMPFGEGPWIPRDNVSPRVWAPLLDVRGWLPSPTSLQIEKWFADWLEPAAVTGATTINASVGNMVLGSRSAGFNTVIGARPGSLTLGAVAARVQLATAINARAATLQLNGTPAKVVLTTVIRGAPGSLVLGGVRANVAATLIVRAIPGNLTLGAVAARVQLATAINAVKSTLQLNGKQAQVQAATTINCHVGSMTLGRVNARVQLATAVNTTTSTLQLNGKPATVQISGATRIDTRPGVLTLGGTPAQITAQAPTPPTPTVPRTFGGGGGPGQLVVRRKRVKVAVHDAIEDRLIIVARTTAAIKPLASQVAAIVQEVSDAVAAVQRAHWTPAHARLHVIDEVDDTALAKVYASDPDLLEFFDMLMEADE